MQHSKPYMESTLFSKEQIMERIDRKAYEEATATRRPNAAFDPLM